MNRDLAVRWVTVAACGLALLMATVIVAAGDLPLVQKLGIPAAFFGASLVGLVVSVRKPDNRMGLVFSVIGVTGLASWLMTALEHSVDPVLSSDLVVWMRQVSDLGWLTHAVALFILLPLWFPTGQALATGWRMLARTAVLLSLIAGFIALLRPRVCVSFDETTRDCLQWVANPIGLLPPAAEGIDVPLLLALLVITVASVVSMAIRFRRSVGVERLQMKWLVYSIVVFVALYVLVQRPVLEVLGVPEFETALGWTLSLAGLAIPVSAGVAILRYRLFDIDRIINRTVVYAVVVGVLALVFAAGVVLIPAAIGISDSSLSVAASTLTVAALFNPLRKRVQRWVDRRFYRSRYDAQVVADQFAAQLRDEVDPNQVASEWVGVVNDTMQPATTAIWMRQR